MNEKKYGPDDEKAVLGVVRYNYSAQVFGEQRIAKYKEVKKILEARESRINTNKNAA